MNRNKKLNWNHCQRPVMDKVIQSVEQYFQITFPKDFIACVKKHNGGYPSRKAFDFEGHAGAVFLALLSFNRDEEGNIIEEYQDIRERLPQRVVPFGLDPFGNYLCFDYRRSAMPTIVFWDHEKFSEDAISYVCDSFEELLHKLYDPDEPGRTAEIEYEEYLRSSKQVLESVAAETSGEYKKE
jgi:hypothetical protein